MKSNNPVSLLGHEGVVCPLWLATVYISDIELANQSRVSATINFKLQEISTNNRPRLL